METQSQKSSSASAGWLLTEKSRLRIMAFTFPIAFVLGATGYYHYPLGGESVNLTNAMYHAAQLFILHAPHFENPVPWTLEIARWLAPVSMILALLNMALSLFQHEQMELVRNRMKNHTIVCGMGRRGIAVAEQIHSEGKPVIAIDNRPNPELEERLNKLGIPLIVGDATRKEILKEARVERAERLYALCDEDTVNCAIAMAANEVSCIAKRPLESYIHINDWELRYSLQVNHQWCQNTKQTLHFVDVFGPEAISLIIHDLPLDHEGIPADDERIAHLVIIGFGRMGRTIAVKAAQLGQFANRKRLQISVIDRHAAENEAALLFHHPYIYDVADFSFYRQEVLSPETRKLVEEWCSESDKRVSIVICFDDQLVVYDTVFTLLPILKKKNIRVAVRVPEPERLDFLLKGTGTDQSINNIIPFGLETSFSGLIKSDPINIEQFAKKIHNAYIELVKTELENDPIKLKERMESKEMKEWNDLNEDFRESNIQQAAHIYPKLRAVGYEIVNLNAPGTAITQFSKDILDILAIMEHNRFVAERKVNNWKYGDPTDKPNRISNNLDEWEHLSVSVREYDYNTVNLIPQQLNSIGKKIIRKGN